MLSRLEAGISSSLMLVSYLNAVLISGTRSCRLLFSDLDETVIYERMSINLA